MFQNIFKKTGKFIFKRIVWYWKRYTVQNNLLLQYGFTKQRPPVPEQGSSQYSLTEKWSNNFVGFWNDICYRK